MYGAILGDMIGSPYEFDKGKKTKDFPMFIEESHFTDDTVMTIAVADALLGVSAEAPDEVICDDIISSMHHWGKKYPDAGYGGRFKGPGTENLMAATATVRPCVCLPLGGSTIRSKRPAGLRG